MRFHHVGYAVADIAEYLDTFFRPLFAPVHVTDPIADPVQRVRVCFAELAGGIRIELVEPFGDDSPVKNIVGDRRGGLYHLCWEVPELEAEIARFRAKGCIPLGHPTPAAAFDGRPIVFLMTPQRDLVELLQGEPAPSPPRGP
jgi:methylmalonyl-CoA/ethylmalonyl-CoA epimerase